ncbi:MAG: Sb-PDE family phosphodiesterase [Bacteroidota bacterium]
MKVNFFQTTCIFLMLLGGNTMAVAQVPAEPKAERIIEFPDIPGYLTLKCDFHIHTVFSDGSVWPDIRVEEAIRDGLDAISITDHIEYQPHKDDIPHADRNRGYEIASYLAKETGLIIINGVEITRSMPPGHANAIFIEDANKFIQEDVMEVFREAKRQGAFVFWNHPHWTAQQPNGIVPLDQMHLDLFREGLIDGIEVYNEYTYSDEALQIALDHKLTILGNSDVHNLVDQVFDVASGGHRPVTLVFATEKSREGIKEALLQRRTALWFDNTLVGSETYLSPMIRQSILATLQGKGPVQAVVLENNSDADYVLQNLSDYTLHNKASVFIVKAHEQTTIHVKTIETKNSFKLSFTVLNAFTAPDKHPEIEIVFQ